MSMNLRAILIDYLDWWVFIRTGVFTTTSILKEVLEEIKKKSKISRESLLIFHVIKYI